MSKVECGTMFETVENLCDVIAPLRIEVWTSAEPLPFARRFEGEYRKLEVGESWGGLFDCGWFRFSGTVPEGEKLCDLALRLDVNGELLIVDAQGRPVRGLTNLSSIFDRTLGTPEKLFLPLEELHLSAGEFEIWADAGAVETERASRLLSGGYGAAIDIGTTTVVCALYAADGTLLGTESRLNGQQIYGADVISRIQHALKGAAPALRSAIRTGVAGLIDQVCRTGGVKPEEVGVVSVVGNPCMQQLFLGVSVANLSAVPFPPVLTRSDVRPAAELLPRCTRALLLTVPDVSGYTGYCYYTDAADVRRFRY